MAFFGKKKTDDDPGMATAFATPPAAENEAAPVVPAAAGLPVPEGGKLVVGPNIRLTGSEITDCDTVIVEGRVEATVDGRVMQIAETGTFTGSVAIDMAEIRGQFQGELTVRRRLTVCGTGKVAGKIRYGALVVEEGGELSGDIASLGSSAQTAKTPPPLAKGNEPAPVTTVDESRKPAPTPAPSIVARKF